MSIAVGERRTSPSAALLRSVSSAISFASSACNAATSACLSSTNCLWRRRATRAASALRASLEGEERGGRGGGGYGERRGGGEEV